MDFIRAKGVVKRWGNSTAGFTMGPLDFEVREGECILVTGGNGSGKSTLLACLAKTLEPDDGQVEWVEGMTEADVLVMDQDYRALCMPWFTARENLEILLHSMRQPEGLETKVRELREHVPPVLQDKLGRPGYALSGGETQAVILSRILLADCRALLLDEPFSSLDADSTDFFLTRLQARCSEDALTCVVIAHEPPGHLRPTRVLEMSNGRLRSRENRA